MSLTFSACRAMRQARHWHRCVASLMSTPSARQSPALCTRHPVRQDNHFRQDSRRLKQKSSQILICQTLKSRTGKQMCQQSPSDLARPCCPRQNQSLTVPRSSRDLVAPPDSSGLQVLSCPVYTPAPAGCTQGRTAPCRAGAPWQKSWLSWMNVWAAPRHRAGARTASNGAVRSPEAKGSSSQGFCIPWRTRPSFRRTCCCHSSWRHAEKAMHVIIWEARHFALSGFREFSALAKNAEKDCSAEEQIQGLESAPGGTPGAMMGRHTARCTLTFGKCTRAMQSLCQQMM